MYKRTYWADHVTDQHGSVIQQGTMLDQEHFNNIEGGLSDTTLAGAIFQFKQIQEDYNQMVELHEMNLSMASGQKWPFNNTPTTVALKQLRESINYSVDVAVLSYAGGCLGSIRITDRAKNGFKVVHDGSATTVKVQIRVSGGMTDPMPSK